MTLRFNDIRPLNEVRYTARDYVTALDRILRHVRDEISGSAFNNFVVSDPAMLLALIGAFIVDQLSFYANRQMSDAFLTTARSHQSILRHARSLGYRIRPATAAVLPVRLTFSTPLPAAATLTAGFSFTADGLTFQVDSDIALSMGATQADITIREGVTSQVSYTASGERLLELILQTLAEGEFVADQSLTVLVNGVEWTESAFLAFEATPQYEVDYLSVPPLVRFGDGVAGQIPAVNHDVQIRYVVCHGSRGNVGGSVAVSPQDTLVVAGQSIAITSAALGTATGGNEPESLDQVRRTAPRYFASRERAVTKDDYIALSLGFSDPAFGSISKATARVSRDVSMDGTASSLFMAISEAAATSKSSIESNYWLIRNALTAIGSLLTQITLITTPLRRRSTTRNLLSGIEDSLELIRGEWAGALPLLSSSRTRASVELAALTASISAGPIASPIRTLFLNQIAIIESVIDTMIAPISLLQGQVSQLQASIEAAGTVDDTLGQLITDLFANRSLIAAQVDIARSANNETRALKSQMDSITASASALSAHISGVLSSDCKANFVLVTVLSRDNRGQLASPSQGLMRRLQDHLRARCDVSHFVRVVSGYDSVVPAQIVAKYVIASGAVALDVESALRKRVEELLAAFDNGAPLDLDMLYQATSDLTGIGRVNFTISGPVARVDVDGNLVPLEHEIISLGSLTITPGVA